MQRNVARIITMIRLIALITWRLFVKYPGRFDTFRRTLLGLIRAEELIPLRSPVAIFRLRSAGHWCMPGGIAAYNNNAPPIAAYVAQAIHDRLNRVLSQNVTSKSRGKAIVAFSSTAITMQMILGIYLARTSSKTAKSINPTTMTEGFPKLRHCIIFGKCKPSKTAATRRTIDVPLRYGEKRKAQSKPPM